MASIDTIEKAVFNFSNSTGDATVTVYTVFPGVQLIYNSVHMDRFDLGYTTKGSLIEVHHCQEGRIEQKFKDVFFYLMPGDLSVGIRNEGIDAYNFPLQHYHGITISINVDAAPQCFSRFLEGVNVQPLEVAQKLCQNKNYFIVRSKSYIEHIFSELYSVPGNISVGYFRVKILELFLILDKIAPQENKASEYILSRSQVTLAQKAAEYIAENMHRRVTIAELAKEFNVSDTTLKKAFKNVYGVPVYSYMRIQKMQYAARLLIYSDQRISEIAYEFGYSNESKFTAAFQKIMGDTPSEYRKAHSKHIITS